ncbi:MAG: glycosyltransferase family 2 protein [Elusimicrobia bacterium]|nr:glycosyltransferase family 2 protein [Elusimicrobiota bacterium]
MLNIVIPIAGRGQRFTEAGYQMPKPLIPIRGIAMIELVIANLRPGGPHRFIFLALREHLEQFDLAGVLGRAAPGCEIIAVDRVTQGAACTVLLARKVIDSNEPLMIANCDQWVDINIDTYLKSLEDAALDGLIMTMKAGHPKWSYVGMDETGRVTRVAEKQVISNEATVGIYNFSRGRDFVGGAQSMIEKNLRVNNEFYVAPVYNELIARGAKIGIFNVDGAGSGMHGLGVPSDLELFVTHAASIKAADAASQKNILGVK